jgi:hypothetical protein
MMSQTAMIVVHAAVFMQGISALSQGGKRKISSPGDNPSRSLIGLSGIRDMPLTFFEFLCAEDTPIAHPLSS